MKKFILRWLINTLAVLVAAYVVKGIHYGKELDSALAYKVKRISDKWEIGWRFGRYWSDRLFSNAIRTSIYTSFTL